MCHHYRITDRESLPEAEDEEEPLAVDDEPGRDADREEREPLVPPADD